MAKVIEIKDVNTNFYTYEGIIKALDSVSLTIDHGSTFGLVGESGCGKSVTARSIMRIVQEPGKIESGKILFYPDPNKNGEGVDLLQKPESYMRDLRGDKISMIFQEPNSALNPIFTIGFQISESLLFHRKKELCQSVVDDLGKTGNGLFIPLSALLKKIYEIGARNPEALLLGLFSRIPILKRWDRLLKKKALNRSIELIDDLGIPNPQEVVKLYPHNLSGGMKQRVVIAIALACHPVLLIADEATSNLDVTIQAQILNLLKELKKKEISSVLLITHDLGVVAHTCDRVGVMYAGQLCEVADVRDIFENPRHPYTSALLGSVPKLLQKKTLQSIEGNVPNLVNPPEGCRFHPRCQYKTDICSEKAPPMEEVGTNHSVACYHHLSG